MTFAFWSVKNFCTLKVKRNFQEWKYRQLPFQGIFCFDSVITVSPATQCFLQQFFWPNFSRPTCSCCRPPFSEGKHFLWFQTLTCHRRSAASACCWRSSWAGLPDWLFWSQKPETWLFWEAVGSKIFIWLFGHFWLFCHFFIPQIFLGEELRGVRVACPCHHEVSSGPPYGCVMSTQIYLKRDRQDVQVERAICLMQCPLNLFLVCTALS